MKPVVRMTVAGICVWIGWSCSAEPAKPWTHQDYLDDAEEFRFAVLPDRAGGDFRGAFTNALAKINLLRPAFVMSVGDLIPGAWMSYEETRRQHLELREMMKAVEPPFFFTPGNHDLISPPRRPQPPVNGVDPSGHADSYALWKEFHGETYFSFVYKRTLFVVLNSNETNDGAGLSDRQYAWARETLAAHPDVRWTFLFMHHPSVWPTAKWETFEDEALSGRRYSVFAGDWHQYLHAKRLGRDYYVLSVAGGCSELHGHRHDLRPVLAGADHGEMDHIVWVTMTGDGPRVANLLLDGILPGDYVNELTTRSRCAAVALDRPVSPELKSRIASNRVWRTEYAKGDDVWVSRFGYNLMDCTDCIQKALDSGARRLVIDAQRGPWITGPVVVRSNTEVIVDDNVEIVRKPGAFKPGQPVFDTSSATNAIVRWRNPSSPNG